MVAAEGSSEVSRRFEMDGLRCENTNRNKRHRWEENIKRSSRARTQIDTTRFRGGGIEMANLAIK